jgi:ATP-binding cassette subfamily B protein
VLSARQYPGLRNIALRVLEPIHAADNALPSAPAPKNVEAASTRAVGLRFSAASVMHAGQFVLRGVNLQVEPGEHIAIVGASGAGKSSLLSLLLGLNECASGSLHADGEPIAQALASGLRRSIAWVDPSVHVWNRSLVENLAYSASGQPQPLAELLEAAELTGLLDSLPDGLQERLGEAGALLAGGEGQRVRLGRALAQGRARLVLLDEPFRGLDRARRQRLLGSARAHWSAATLLCVTHDMAQAAEFARVWVVQHGRVVEDGPPEVLARAGGSYAALLEAQRGQDERVWQAAHWRHHALVGGHLSAAGSRARAMPHSPELPVRARQLRGES